MKKIFFLLCGIFFFTLSVSSEVKGRVTDKKGEPIPGANIHWLNTVVGAVSDNLGEFKIQELTGNSRLVITNIAYRPDTVDVVNAQEYLNVILNDQIQLSEATVVAKTPGTFKSHISVLQTEKINAAELAKAACCNLSESFETNPSVDVSYSDAATGAKQIKLLGLSGTYVQMLTENIPNLRGISSAYGLGYIPGPWMESIQVSKGTASVINGYEAITGQINVEYKKPISNEIASANMFLSDAGRIEANLTASAKLSDHLSTSILLHGSDELVALDQNGDNFMDMPMIKQYNLANRWYYKNGKYESQAFLRALSETRMGGQVAGDYHIGIETERYEFFLKNGYIFDSTKGQSIGFIVSGSLHNQDAHYGTKKYDGNQGNLYANLIYATSFGKQHKLSTGTSFNLDNYKETLLTNQSSVYPRKEFVPGAFAEYTLNLNDKFIALAGIRADYNSLYGAFVTPRLHLKYNMNEHLHFRASAGKGFRSPNVLAENNFLLASNRVISIDPNLKMEEAWNYGLSAQSFIPVFDKKIDISAEWYYTDFKQQVVADMDSDPHAVKFSNLDGRSYSSSAQLEVNMELVDGFTLTLAHRLTDVQTTIGGILREKPLTSRSKSLATASYQTPQKEWQFDFTAQFNGGGRLPDPDTANPLWKTTFDPYTILNAQVTKYFKNWSVYVGSENMTNFMQDNPIIDVQNPLSGNFDASMVWGPVHGVKFYVGFRWAINREN